MKKTDTYIIKGGKDGKERLDLLSGLLTETTRSLLEANGVTTGVSFLDVGCGGGNVALMAAQMTGDTGRVTAIDFDATIIALDREDAAHKKIHNISYQAMSAYDLDFHHTFDVAYSRFLLSHLTEPRKVLANMAESVKPGGTVIVEDIDFCGHFCYPACAAFDQYIQLFTATAKKRGQHPDIGPSLFSMFEAAGIANIRFEVIQPVFSEGPGKWMAHLTMDRIRDSVLSEGLASKATLSDILDALRAFTEDGSTVISLPRIFRVWGIKKKN
jgi:ubiquinone/menaquinone biosynthesis C-methylase UbiE